MKKYMGWVFFTLFFLIYLLSFIQLQLSAFSMGWVLLKTKSGEQKQGREAGMAGLGDGE